MTILNCWIYVINELYGLRRYILMGVFFSFDTEQIINKIPENKQMLCNKICHFLINIPLYLIQLS